ncbi:MAG: hypothetical protein WCB27_01240 [Thermoguttaceae bacterium]
MMKTIAIVLALSCVGAAAFAAEKTARVSAPAVPGPLAFAAGEIRSALKSGGWNVAETGHAAIEITLEEPSGAGKIDAKPESFKIDVVEAAGRTTVRIRGADLRGAMYGGLDVAEQIRLYGSVKAKSESPYLAVRAMKFNPPLRGNVYMSDEDLKNSGWFYDLEYWDRFMRTMTYNRYNTLTLWCLHPYDHMVRLKKYPEATTLSQDRLDKNIVFFHKLFQMAKNYGLDTYIVTWNIHLSPGFRKAHGLRDGQDSPLIRDYEKECIRELLGEYPELTGMGTCPGENMPMSAAANAEWIRDVYLDTLAKTGRKMPFIYRYWGARPKETVAMLEKAHYPGEILLDIKFNGEHMYSSTKPHPEEMGWLTQKPKPYKLLWHLRNDCIFQLRWGDPEFAGQTLTNCGGPESAGFVTGSEIEIPGVDRYHTPQTAAHRTWKYEFEKNWMRFAVWGRMGYDPKLPDEYWIARFSERFGPAAGKDAFLALKYASKIIPTVTSFHWNYMNGDWYPEGNIGGWNTSDGMKKPNFREDGIFHDIREWIFNNVIDDSLMNIPDSVTGVAKRIERVDVRDVAPPNAIAPADVVVALINTAKQSEGHATLAASKIEHGAKEWECMELDLRASAELGRYYAWKAIAAVNLMVYLATGNDVVKSAAVMHLENARECWRKLAAITKSHYVTHEIWLVGQFDWAMYLPQVEKDIEIARKMKPWTKEEQTWTSADGKTIATTTRWRADGWPKDIEPWVRDFNARVRSLSAAIDIPAGSWIKTKLHVASPGFAVVRLFAPGTSEVKARARSFSETPEGLNTIVADLRAGSNEFAVRYEKESHTLPMLEMENAPASIFLTAMEAQLTSPMTGVARSDAAGGFVIVAPLGSGRGEKGGKVLDNGYVTYKVNISKDGEYRLNARVFWKNGDCDSFFYAWDDGKPKLLGNDDVFGRWHWIQTEAKRLKAGEHTLVIRNREEGSILDCMTVTPDKP